MNRTEPDLNILQANNLFAALNIFWQILKFHKICESQFDFNHYFLRIFDPKFPIIWIKFEKGLILTSECNRPEMPNLNLGFWLGRNLVERAYF